MLQMIIKVRMIGKYKGFLNRVAHQVIKGLFFYLEDEER